MQVKGEKASVQQYLCLCNAVGCVHLENCHCEHICDLPFLIFSVCVCEVQVSISVSCSLEYCGHICDLSNLHVCV